MSTTASRTTRWRAHAAVAVSFGLMFAGTAWSGVPEKREADLRATAGDEVEVIRSLTPPGAAAPQGALGATGVFIEEAEPNDTSATAQALDTLPIRVRARLDRAPFVAGNVDVDVFSFTAGAGDRVYAATMTAFSAGSTDSVLEILDVDGTTVLEVDDQDGTLSTSASNIAGTLLPAAGTYYVRVRQFGVTSLTGTIRPYDLYVQVQSGAPTAEVEPNNNGQTPNPIPASGWVRGVIDPVGDNDTFSVTANAGDTIYVIQDLDPERDAPEWNGRVGIGVFNNFLLVTGDAGTFDVNPSEALFMTVKTSGTFVIYVDAQVAGVGGPAATYQLSVGVIPGHQRTCTTYTGGTGAIADLGTTNFTVAVADPRKVDYLRVSVTASHAAPGDLDVSLISPDGNEVGLFDDPLAAVGAAAPQFNVVLEDDGAAPISTFGVHSGMHYSPELGARLEYFKGMEAQGTWTLRVRDDLTGNAGTLDALSLTVCEADPRPACMVPGPNETTIYSSDFETGDGGFTHSGTGDEWERGTPAFPPVTTAHSGANAWETDLDNTYENSTNADLISPPIDLTGVNGRITLSWWHKFHVESASFDRYWVEVRQVGAPATARRLFDWTGASMNRTMGSPSVTVQQSVGWGQVQADVTDFAGDMIEIVYHLGTDPSVQYTGIAVDDVLVTSCDRLAGAAAEALAVDAGGNNVFEPNETVAMAPTWRNTHSVAFGLTGTLSNHVGPTGGTYGIPDTDASYGTINANASASCSATGDCYSVSNTMTSRPATHWDSTADEDVTGGPEPITKTWTLHIGESFTDVPAANLFYRFIETLLHRGVTGGCTSSTYCPTSSTSREQMAVFVLVSKDQAAPPPAACVAGSEMFADVPAGSPFCRWIEELARRGVVSGCGGGNYCPLATATREAMAVFVLRTLDGTLNPPACVAGSEMFADVPATSVFCRWIEELARRAVVTGCGGGNYCPTADVSREQMSVFLSVTFGLALYGI